MNPFLAWTEAPYSIPLPTPPHLPPPPARARALVRGGVLCMRGEGPGTKNLWTRGASMSVPSTDILVDIFLYLLWTCLCMFFGTSVAPLLQPSPRGCTYAHVYSGGLAFFSATVGCGTGILSMFAAQAGAKHVYGIDMSVLCGGVGG